MAKKKQAQVYFFSGKGGVGKTTTSAATALWFSGHGKNTLVVSIDPAHSLSDSFEEEIGGEVMQLGKNLHGLEIDPAKSMQEYKDRLAPKLENGLFKSLGLGDTLDIAGMTPGMDEVAAFNSFLKYMNSDEYDVIIFDTAPTGHALRFLSLPDVLDSWVGKLIKIRMQFAGMAGMFSRLMSSGKDENDKETFGAEQLEVMRQRISTAKGILSDPGRTHFNLVLIPEDMSILESERSLKTLREFGIPVEGVIVNNIVPENSGCSFCQTRRKSQLSKMKSIRKKFSDCDLREIPLFPVEVKGRRMLDSVAKILYGS